MGWSSGLMAPWLIRVVESYELLFLKVTEDINCDVKR